MQCCSLCPGPSNLHLDEEEKRGGLGREHLAVAVDRDVLALTAKWRGGGPGGRRWAQKKLALPKADHHLERTAGQQGQGCGLSGSSHPASCSLPEPNSFQLQVSDPPASPGHAGRRGFLTWGVEIFSKASAGLEARKAEARPWWGV